MRSSSTTCREPATPGPRGPRRRPQAGFTLVSAVFVVVVLAALGAAMARMSLRQHMGSAAELDTARALQAARGGLEWAAFQVLRNPVPPAAAPACFGDTSFTLAGLPAFTVTVRCTRTPGSGTVSDGDSERVFYQMVVNACNAPSSGACPAAGTLKPTYVERQLTATLTR